MRLIPLLAASLVLGSAANAAENETVFLEGQGTLVIPRLVIGDDIYYAQMDRANLNGYTFNLDTTTAVDVTPEPSDQWATALEVVGNWTAEGSTVELALDADGTYNWNGPGGVETGTYTLDEYTGVIFFRALEDANGEGGLSHPKNAIRVSRDGDNLVATLSRRQNGTQVDTDLTLVPAAE
jgi:hypothetical protein